MRLMIIGRTSSPIATAGKIAVKRGVKVTHCEDASQALNALRSGQGADLIMCDVRFDIAGLLQSLESERIIVPLIACGVQNDAKAAVAAIKAGAQEYVPLPPDPELIAAVFEAVARDDRSLLAEDPAMLRVIQMAEKVAPSQASVLISGESGTGKELMARLIHDKSPRKGQAFIALNCAAIPETLLESELFGHEKGAFTGAVARRLGKFEEAAGGTLFLDEISEMAIELQAKLLRAIQEKEITRLGANRPVSVDVRIVATTNRNLEKEIKAGTFREDLYFRLNVINLKLPSLRERPKDIPMLARHFASKFAKDNGVPERKVTLEAMQMLEAYHWPGNVRELENTMHRAILLASGDSIDTDAIILSEAHAMPQPPAPTTATAATPQNATLAEGEKNQILSTLGRCLGDQHETAKILGISVESLRQKLMAYKQDIEET